MRAEPDRRGRVAAGEGPRQEGAAEILPEHAGNEGQRLGRSRQRAIAAEHPRCGRKTRAAPAATSTVATPQASDFRPDRSVLTMRAPAASAESARRLHEPLVDPFEPAACASRTTGRSRSRRRADARALAARRIASAARIAPVKIVRSPGGMIMPWRRPDQFRGPAGARSRPAAFRAPSPRARRSACPRSPRTARTDRTRGEARRRRRGGRAARSVAEARGGDLLRPAPASRLPSPAISSAARDASRAARRTPRSAGRSASAVRAGRPRR